MLFSFALSACQQASGGSVVEKAMGAPQKQRCLVSPGQELQGYIVIIHLKENCADFASAISVPIGYSDMLKDEIACCFS